jgi:hypothetical protein
MRIHRVIGLGGMVLAVSLLVPACGGSGGAGASDASGVEASKKLTALTDAEKGTLCDWMVGRAGSYGNPGTCDRTQPAATSPFLAYDDQAACVADSPDATFTSCQATVAQLEACVKTLPVCATLTDASNSSACAILSSC